jgi:Holliday junction resolvase
MGVTNKKLGNTFESELCQYLFEKGFWAHNLAQNSAGQPADVIAVRNKVAYLIDCKVCSGKGFRLSRIEANQESSMTLWKERGNGNGWFAIKVEDEIYMIPLNVLQSWRLSKSTLSHNDILDMGAVTLERWVNLCK